MRSTIDEKRKLGHAEDAEPAENNLNIFHSSANSARNPLNLIYKGEFNKSIKQNFKTFSPTDFIAAITAHIPERHQKYTNFYGYYSNKSRGLRAKEGVPEIEENVSTHA